MVLSSRVLSLRDALAASPRTGRGMLPVEKVTGPSR